LLISNPTAEERGRVGERESGRGGEGEWESGRVGDGKNLPSNLEPLTSSF